MDFHEKNRQKIILKSAYKTEKSRKNLSRGFNRFLLVLWNSKLTLLFILLKVGTNKLIQTAVCRSGAYPGFWAWIFNIISKQLFPLILQVGTNKYFKQQFSEVVHTQDFGSGYSILFLNNCFL